MRVALLTGVVLVFGVPVVVLLAFPVLAAALVPVLWVPGWVFGAFETPTRAEAWRTIVFLAYPLANAALLALYVWDWTRAMSCLRRSAAPRALAWVALGVLFHLGTADPTMGTPGAEELPGIARFALGYAALAVAALALGMALAEISRAGARRDGTPLEAISRPPLRF